jgi:two-component system LytT family response regulator
MMLTSDDRTSSAARARALGAQSYLIKPIRQEDLLASIRKVMKSSRGLAVSPAVLPAIHTPAFSARILVAEDNPVNQKLAVALLCKMGHHVVSAATGVEAVETWRTGHFDLILMDVQMPEMDGFGVVQEIGPEMPAVVFVTAHDQYAIQAFEISALDYLLKPVTAERFAKALERAKSRLQSRPADDSNRQILSLLETIATPRRYLKRLAVRAAGKTVFVDIEDVDWMEAAENYVQIHAAGSGHLLHVTMNALEKSLDPEVFVRIHRSVIVNVRRIRELQPVMHGEYVIQLENGARLQSGRMYSDRVKALTANPF